MTSTWRWSGRYGGRRWAISKRILSATAWATAFSRAMDVRIGIELRGKDPNVPIEEDGGGASQRGQPDRDGAAARAHIDHPDRSSDDRRPAASRAMVSSIVASTSRSVSGRGMSARGSTDRAIRRTP